MKKLLLELIENSNDNYTDLLICFVRFVSITRGDISTNTAKQHIINELDDKNVPF